MFRSASSSHLECCRCLSNLMRGGKLRGTAHLLRSGGYKRLLPRGSRVRRREPPGKHRSTRGRLGIACHTPHKCSTCFNHSAVISMYFAQCTNIVCSIAKAETFRQGARRTERNRPGVERAKQQDDTTDEIQDLEDDYCLECPALQGL
jgi:hypothetical protein